MAGASEFVLQIQAVMKGNAADELSAARSAADEAIKKYQELERASARTATELEKLGAKASDLSGRMKSAMEAGDTDTFWKLATQASAVADKQSELEAKAKQTQIALEEQADAAEDLSAAYASMRDAQDATTEASKATAQSQEKVIKTGDALTKLPGPLGAVGGRAKEFTESWKDLSQQLGTSKAAMVVAGAALVALAAVAAYAIGKMAAFAITTADARRNLTLTLEAIEGTAAGGQRLADAIAEVDGATNLGTDRLLDLTRSLKDAGVSAADMPAALRAIAMQEKALGDQGGTQALIDDLKAGKKSAAELAAEMEKQYGGVVEKKMLSLEDQSKTLQKNLADLFGGGNIDGFLRGLSKLVGLFDQNTEAGRALKAIVDSMFGGFGGAEAIFTTIERYFLGLISGALTLALWIKRVAKALDIDTSGLSKLVDVADLGKIAVGAMAIAFLPLAAAIGAVVALVYGLSAAFSFLGAAGTAAWQWIKGAFDTVSSALEGFDLAAIGTAMIDGLVQAIKNGASRVASAIGDVAKSAISSAKSTLGIASPSKVFEELGGYTVEGFTLGVDAMNDNAQASMESAIAPPEPKRAARGGGGGNTFNVTVNVSAGADADLAAEVRRAVVGALEDAAEQMGAGPVEEAT